MKFRGLGVRLKGLGVQRFRGGFGVLVLGV